MNFDDYIRTIPDFPKPGIQFKDITPLLASPRAFPAAVEALASAYPAASFDAVAAVEARGFLFAAPLALHLQKPLIPLRKPGKLPYTTISQKYDLEYGQAELHMHTDGVHPGQRVLLVDDLLATGGTMHAACQLIEQVGGKVAGLAFLIELTFLPGRLKLQPYPTYSLLKY